MNIPGLGSIEIKVEEHTLGVLRDLVLVLKSIERKLEPRKAQETRGKDQFRAVDSTYCKRHDHWCTTGVCMICLDLCYKETA